MTTRAALATGRKLHVGIIGAGFAGLRCADVLLRHGCKVTILEARNRVGGRVAQSMHLGHAVDLGPNWIHGASDNPIMHVATRTGTRLHAWDGNQAAFDPKGQAVDPDEVMEYNRLIWDDGLITTAFKYSNDHCEEIDPQRSLYDFFMERSKNFFKDEPADEAKRKHDTLSQVFSFWGAYVGGPVQRQTLKFFWLEEGIDDGDNPFVAETYHKIRDAVAKPALEGAEIRYGAVVEKITYPTPEETSGKSTVSVETKQGERYDFDEVVVTTPLGWLKRNLDAFSPKLPERLAQAMNSIGYGTLDKVYITFPSAFWDDGPEQQATTSVANGIDTQRTTPNVTATTTPLHQRPSERGPTGRASFWHWLKPSYARDSNAAGWDMAGMNLAALSKGCAQPTLLFYIYGDCSKHIGSIVADTSSSPSERDAKLVAFFEPYFSLLPNYSEGKAECKPKAVLATAWAIDEFAGYGSYSNFQIGLERGGEDIEVMREGVPDQRLWFAGEHTAPFIALGTTTGAYWSGEKVAKRICAAYGMNSDDVP